MHAVVGQRRGEGSLERLVRAHGGEFLGFLRRRVESPALAEELLQTALLRGVERGVPDADEAGLRRWFFQVLRNLVVDHWRSRGFEARAMQREALLADDEGYEPEHASRPCVCVHEVLATLKPEVASIVRAVHLEDRSVAEAAAAQQVSSNHASVRLYRGRAALKAGVERKCGACAADGCGDCSCQRAA